MKKQSAAARFYTLCKRAHFPGRQAKRQPLPLPRAIADMTTGKQAAIAVFNAMEAACWMVATQPQSFLPLLPRVVDLVPLPTPQRLAVLAETLGKLDPLLRDAAIAARDCLLMDGLASIDDQINEPTQQLHRLHTQAADQSGAAVTPSDVAQFMLALAGSHDKVDVYRTGGVGLFLSLPDSCRGQLAIEPDKRTERVEVIAASSEAISRADRARAGFESLFSVLSSGISRADTLLINAAEYRRPFGEMDMGRGLLAGELNAALSLGYKTVAVLVRNDILTGARSIARDLLAYCAGRGLRKIVQLPPGTLNSNGQVHSVMLFDRSSNRREIEFVEVPAAATEKKLPAGFGFARRMCSLGVGCRDGVVPAWPARIMPLDALLKQETNTTDLKGSSYEARRLINVDPFLELKGRLTFAPLKSIAEVFRTHHLSNSGEDDTTEFIELGVSDIDRYGEITARTDAFRLCDREVLKSRGKQVLQVGDIVMCFRGAADALGRVGLIRERPKQPWVPNQSFVIIRLKDVMFEDPFMAPPFLNWWLRSSYAADFVRQKSISPSVPRLAPKDLMELLVPRGPANLLYPHLEAIRKFDQLLAKRREVESQLSAFESPSWSGESTG